ncbi:hypothetical protein M8756_09225 [Lutimaribacter sp. EGI FJ00015]|uniref:Uncharacterized protein n=1 Tax=Lutimaribacter degradans TaxID=2945989 RepID=A0ACC5ZVY3_9RHOB|nr:hypothetical protein [Lutimaribacter sp. EGI FJ00013]MCM2562333.1 hypothetical protein [Lutimaribacter sp. EGI FJ00013]MCO0613488.1 hypothetical protein [Lutimaribacter sp. EGI FJ00015]MCO0636462.1 hypothetical protein [Lutimaribacter sp. EGI FJ00014]
MIDLASEADILALADMLHGPGALQAPRLQRAMGQGAQMLVYRLQGVPRGYLIWSWSKACDAAPESAGRLAVLDHVQVEPNFRRHGMARRLIARFEMEIARAGAAGWGCPIHRKPGCAALMCGAGALIRGERFEKRLQTPHSSNSPATSPL